MRRAMPCSVLLALVWTAAAGADVFALIDLGRGLAPTAINHAGEIMGYTPTAGTLVIGPGDPRLFGPELQVLGLGQDGHVVGIMNRQAVVARDMQHIMTLPALPGDGPSFASARTARAVTVGSSQHLPVRWRDGVVERLPVLPGWSATPGAVNGWAQPCGLGTAPDGQVRAVMWAVSGAMIGLPPLPGGGFAMCRAITRRGETFGVAQRADASRRPVQWDALTRLRELPLAPDAAEGEVLAANDDGLAVGWERRVLSGPGGEDRAVAWLDGVRYDLTALAQWPGWAAGAAGWTLTQARGVNARGAIVGIGTLHGGLHGWLLAPTPGAAMAPR